MRSMPKNMSLKAWKEVMEQGLAGNDAMFAQALEEAPNPMPKDIGDAALALACLLANPIWVGKALELGAKPHSTILSTMAHQVDEKRSPSSWKECVKLLIEKGGVRLDRRVEWGYSGLHHALREASEAAPWAAMALLDLGASTTLKTKDGESPMDLALAYGNVDVARRLSGQGLAATPPSSALTLAVLSNSPAMVAWALGQGEDPDRRSHDWRAEAKEGATLSMVQIAKLNLKTSLQAMGGEDRCKEIQAMLRAASEAKRLSKCVKAAKRKTSGPSNARARSL